MRVALRPATADDVPLLAEMNHRLIQDEGSRNPMSVAELADRMRGWLAADYTALLVLVDEAVAGYLLYRVRGDEYFPDRQEVYLRQYFIRAEYRGQGIGRAALAEAFAHWLPSDADVIVEVLEANPGALRFWERAGFVTTSRALRRPAGS